jgi:hypothetical protein
MIATLLRYVNVKTQEKGVARPGIWWAFVDKIEGLLQQVVMVGGSLSLSLTKIVDPIGCES